MHKDFQEVRIGKVVMYYSYCNQFIISYYGVDYTISLDDNFANQLLRARFSELPKEELRGDLETILKTYKCLKSITGK